jgi:hypothetical protein
MKFFAVMLIFSVFISFVRDEKNKIEDSLCEYIHVVQQSTIYFTKLLDVKNQKVFL